MRADDILGSWSSSSSPLALAGAALNAVPVIGAVRLGADVAAQMRYCQTVEDPQTPWYCDPDAVRLDVETRPGAW
jgi:hypothetical protein